MKLVEKLNKVGKIKLQEFCNQLLGIWYPTKQEAIDAIIQYYHDPHHFIYLFTDSEIFFLESENDDRDQRKLLKNEIQSLKDRYFICYDSSSKRYVLYEDLMEVYYQYRELYTKEEREKYGLIRYLLIAYVNAYGILNKDQLEMLFKDLYSDFDLEELIQLIEDSNYYQNQILVLKREGIRYFCIHDELLSRIALDCIPETMEYDFATLDEDTLLAYYYDGYDSSIKEVYELRKILNLNRIGLIEFKRLILFTYALLQSKYELQEFILLCLRYTDLPHRMIVDAFSLVDSIYHNYGSWITRGYSPERVEKMIEQNIQMMKEELEDTDLFSLLDEKEEPIN